MTKVGDGMKVAGGGPVDPAKVMQLLVSVLGFFALQAAYLYPFHLEPWTSFYNELASAVAVGLGLAYSVMHAKARSGVQLAHPGPWLLLLLLVAVHAWVWGAQAPAKQDTWLMFTLFGLVGWLAYSVGLTARTQNWVGWVLQALLLAALVSATIAVLQWGGLLVQFDGVEGFLRIVEEGERAPSNIGQANQLGTLLVMGCWAVGFAWYSSRKRPFWWRLLALFAWLVLVLGVHVSGSRTALLNLMLAPVLLALWSLFHRQRQAWVAWVPVGLWGLWYLVLPMVAEWLAVPMPTIRSLASDPIRMKLWHLAWAAVAEQPWLGHGFAGMANAHLRLVAQFGVSGINIATSAHNSILDMWVVFGVVLGSAVVLGVVGLWLRAWLACVCISEQFVWLMTTAMIVHAMLEYPLHYGYYFWLLCFLVGALGGRPWKSWAIRRPIGLVFVWLLVFGAGAFTIWRTYVETEALYTQYRQRGAAATHAALVAKQDTLAVKLYPELHSRLYWLTTPMDELDGLSVEQFRALEAEASTYPLPMLGWRVAFGYGFRGDGAKAAWWAEHMCKMYAPDMCASAQQEWLRRAEQRPTWPVLPWDSWAKVAQ